MFVVCCLLICIVCCLLFVCGYVLFVDCRVCLLVVDVVFASTHLLMMDSCLLSVICRLLFAAMCGCLVCDVTVRCLCAVR